ncbi:Fis family transcriptional regulator [Geobacillus stearothermophilus]|uniref:HTH-type transcriptional regulatory protein TyrR n=1 Tax=Geobacillus stearothermophilus TaxID=1422 RepID=Q75TI2_GEOSE|nr:sigma 54-interacting transcriptional regulator [Geobacillus zalihae]KFL15034.1 Fis family transcriptional regulator [Geobacillus stearothermophilus]KFX35251.1 Fis family transcriptional regulator [Geobacillus stearothermophilus]QOR82973.1 sigma 54-interacting transcriptional regulator [Geobacillus stearothermophilus]WJP99071.1 sigma 54-interacting transcriptional regulator [Geobacillus stearothermophilus]WJQ02361.1 sigma 54-interacting transcriptional regulator [Geobacillus stearothermophil
MQRTADVLEFELDAILRSSNDNIVIADENGIVLRASPNCLSIYGKDASYLVGKSVYQLEKENVFCPSVTARVLREKKEVQLMQQTATGRVVMATGVPVFDQQNRLVRVISFSHDLTELERLKEDYEKLRKQMEHYQMEIEELKPDHIVIQSKAMERIWKLVHRVAQSDATVLFLGESGVGKNVFARSLHLHSPRRNEPFIEVNCSAIPESLFESEMFGYEKGSFTGAQKTGKPGLIELADKGTLFLDEIGELPLSMQAKLLKVLQEKKVIRVGGIKERTVDFRLIASTNQNLEQMVKQGKFRQDLFYRLHVIPIYVPSLRERKEDIFMLAQYFLKKFNEKYQMDKYFHPSIVDHLIQYDWPGNVRELENMIERLVITSETRAIYPEYLPFSIQKHPEVITTHQSLEKQNEPSTLKEAMEQVERQWLLRAVKQCKTTYEMADYLGISQPTVVRKLKKYGIDSKTN